MRTFIFTMMALACFACGNQATGVWTLDGKLEDVKEGWAYLTKLDGEWEVVDSTQIEGGHFKFEVNPVEGVTEYYLQFKDVDFNSIYVKNILPVFCEQGAVKWNGNIKENKFDLSGTTNNNALNDYNQIFHTISNSLYHLLYVDQSWRQDTVHGPYVAQGKYLMLAELMPKFRQIYAEKYKDLEFSLAIFQEICMMDQNLRASKVDSLLAGVPEHLHASPIYRDLKAKADKLRFIGVGGIAPDFELPTSDGKTVSLYSYRGRYMLLVFWASWCGPCRAEIPHLMEIYEKYHEKGLDILSVSVDNQKAAWEKAIADTGMPWRQASDLKGLKGEVAKLYAIDGVPALWLINPEGEILAVNLRGEDLDNKLQEIFSKGK